MFKGFFKPLKKRDAKIAAVLFGIVLLILAYNLVKDLFGGKTFDELHSNIMLIAFFAIIEWGMVVISTSKDKDENAANEDASPENSAALLEGSDEKEGSEEFTEGLSEEFEGYGSSDAGEYGGEGTGADAVDGSGEAGGEAG
jgi:hypothetical protein